MSLTDVLKFRYPVVWVNTLESERLILNLPSLVTDRELYVFDDFKGLTVWNEESRDFKIVTIEVTHPETDEIYDVPITNFSDAFSYTVEKKSEAIFVIRNFHKGAENYYNVIASLFNDYYRTFRFDNVEHCPVTVLCLSPDPEVPREIVAMTAIENFDTPSHSAIVELLTYMASRIPIENAIAPESIVDMADACRGMTEFSIIDTVLGLVRKDGSVSSDAIVKIKYERLKAATSLDIVQPRWGLEGVGGLDYAKEIITKAQWIRDHPKEAKAKGVRPINKILLLGVPGSGKSMLCEAASKTLGLDLAKVGVSLAMNRFVGQSEANMREMFHQINLLAPIAVWIDELGRDFQSGNFDSGTTERVHGELLTGLQNLPDSVALFAAANDISSLPPEMLRAERFDKILFVGYPSLMERMEIFRINLPEETWPDGVEYDWEELAANTSFFTGAEIVQLLNNVRFDCLMDPKGISTAAIIQGIDKMKNRLWIRARGTIIGMYRRAIDEHEWASTDQFAEAHDIVEGRAFNPARRQSSSARGMTIKS